MTHSRYASIYTYPALVSQQLQKADTNSGDQAIEDEFNDYFALCKRYCRDYSKIIEERIGRTFVPYYASKDWYFADAIADYDLLHSQRRGTYMLNLREDLLVIDNVTWNGTALTSTQYRVVDAGNNTFGYPYDRLLVDSSNTSYGTDFDDKATIVGEWGVHDNATDSYATVSVLAEDLDTVETAIDVANGQGDLFEIFQYIRVNDELMLITDIDSSGDPDVLTVERGVNGFTATTHTTGDTITLWNVVKDVQELTTRMVAYYFNKRDDKGEKIQVIDDALVLAQFDTQLAQIAERRKRSFMVVT